MRPVILNRLEELGYAIFSGNHLDLNIIGVRSADKTPNVFNDKLYLVYKKNGIWVEHIYTITTDPGIYWLENPSRVSGTAILKAGQYRSCYQIGLHRGSYTALTQRKPVTVYRDSNRDDVFDMNPTSTETGYFGINIHRSNSSRESTQVNKWSAGCQVFANPDEYEEFISICESSIPHQGAFFTYTLIED